MAVPVTVIIPTYNWSEALRISITSVLAQTHADFELLVIGDCCTDDSAAVAASFDDARIHWHNLPDRAKSQSGPNNFGNSIASGELIAYLGHDDVWHPQHLELVVAKAVETRADIVCGVTAMYGPPSSGVRAVCGVFMEDQYRSTDFIPPSSMLHQRYLADRIGPWGDPATTASPVDVDLLRRARKAGCRIVSTGRLTVFKFNSAWRQDSYLHRNTSEQSRMLERLAADPAKCVEEEWTDLWRAMTEKRLVEMTVPVEEDSEPGRAHRVNMRNRGLEDGELSLVTEATRFTLDGQTNPMEWHLLEQHAKWGSFRWSGPSPVCTVILPVRQPRSFRLRLRLLNWFKVDLESEVTLSLARAPMKFSTTGDGDPAITLEASVSNPIESDSAFRLQIATATVRCPYLCSAGASPDYRWMGVCVNWVEIEPADLTTLDPDPAPI